MFHTSALSLSHIHRMPLSPLLSQTRSLSRLHFLTFTCDFSTSLYFFPPFPCGYSSDSGFTGPLFKTSYLLLIWTFRFNQISDPYKILFAWLSLRSYCIYPVSVVVVYTNNPYCKPFSCDSLLLSLPTV